MSRRPRRNHAPAFKAKVALAALKGDKTLAEMAEQFDVHSNQITEWKNRQRENSEVAFGKARSDAAPPVDLNVLHAKIGELTLENNFLEGALTKVGLLSARSQRPHSSLDRLMPDQIYFKRPPEALAA